MSQGNFGGFDSRAVLIDILGENRENFEISCLNFKNGKGVKAIYEMERLVSEMMDFAKDPTIRDDQLGPGKPREPNTEGMTEEEKERMQMEYRELLRQYELAQAALRMQIPIPDMTAIIQYMKPFRAALHATSAVKGKRFHAFTKQIEEEQGGMFGLRQASKATR